MSRVYFHSPSDEAELRGSERAYAGNLVNQLALACLQPGGWKMRERLTPLIPASSYLHSTKDEHWASTFETWWSVSMGESSIRVGDQETTPWRMSLNTAVVIGSDPIELLARLHATCEIHGYVEGEHRAWLASIIDEGRERKVLRPGMGWEDVSAMLLRRDDEPVVMSYSVCDSFPNAGLAKEAGLWGPGSDHQGIGEDGEPWWDGDEWYDIPEAERWRLGMESLRKIGRTNVDLQPRMWGERLFGTPALTVFDLLESL